MEQQYVMKNKRRLRRGVTTGTCASAAASAAVRALTGQKAGETVSIRLPSGQTMDLKVTEVSGLENRKSPVTTESDIVDGLELAEYYVNKDAGDDPDVTNGAEIHVRAEFQCIPLIEQKNAESLLRKERKNADPDDEKAIESAPLWFRDPDDQRIMLTSGEGVGIVTQEGLEVGIGYPAINRVPRKMIFEAARTALLDAEAEIPEGQVLLLTVSVPGGAEVAERTFNPHLGIRGGISILGTSGIVEPMSEAALVATIELEVKKTLLGESKRVIFVPGNYGRRYAGEFLKLAEEPVECSNFVGDAIDLAVGYGASSILLIGNFGKLVKLAAGIMNTHSAAADGRWEIIAAHSALAGAPVGVLKEIRKAVTTDQMLKILIEAGLKEAVMESVLMEIDRHLKRRAGTVRIGAVIFSESCGLLGQTETAADILKEIRE